MLHAERQALDSAILHYISDGQHDLCGKTRLQDGGWKHLSLIGGKVICERCCINPDLFRSEPEPRS